MKIAATAVLNLKRPYVSFSLYVQARGSQQVIYCGNVQLACDQRMY